MPKSILLGRAPQMLIRVSQKAIDDGVERISSHCVFAQAIKETRPELIYVAVDLQTIRATDPKKRERYIYLTPRAVQQAIVDFDQGTKPQAFRFTLREGQVIRSGQGMYLGTRAEKAERRRKSKFRRSGRKVPTLVGGIAPPRSKIGAIRAFGIRALKG